MPRSKSEAEALERLRERLQATQEAASRLADEARAAAGGSKPPPSGWDVPGRADDTNAELEALVSMLGTLREALPPELRAQLAELVRALLVFVRAVLDFAIGQLEAPPRPPRSDDDGVQDIPIS